MLSYSYVQECVDAQPHPLDSGSHHPGDHSLLLPGAHPDADCAHSHHADGDANPFPDIHSQRYANRYPDRDAQHDFNSDCHQHIDGKTQLDPNPDIYSNIKTNRHYQTNIHANLHTAAHIDANLYTIAYIDANLHTAAYINAHSHISPNPFGYTVSIRYGYSCSNPLS